MELQWKSNPCSHLRCSVRQVQNQEQTLELRLTDGMPDIGRVLCAWGQWLLHSKQWRSDGMQISGGVNAWVLYAPEDGSEPRCVEGWIPFQAKWNFPESHREGIIRIDGCIRSMDDKAAVGRSQSRGKVDGACQRRCAWGGHGAGRSDGIYTAGIAGGRICASEDLSDADPL